MGREATWKHIKNVAVKVHGD